ncbi:MAG: hypothetical protein HQ551_04605 [Desulfobacteraceae bacterium]|nr:hypothetical protein [Desulfobacteraceae bacterium]
MARRKWSWTDLQKARVKEVIKIADDLKSYWPLTIRQIHYQLFARKIFWGGRRDSKIYPNTKSGQGDLIKVAKYARIEEMLSWDAIEDRTRSLYRPYKFEDIQSYLKNELHYLLSDYKRCLVQDQDVYLELWIEKDALFKIFKKVAQSYCVPVIACKGYDSITYLHHFHDMAEKALSQGRTPTVLYFGDLDPSGVAMLESSITTLEDEMGLRDAKFKRIAVNPDQVIKYELPNDPDAGKSKDTRYEGYIDKYGYVFVELDALHPHQLEDMARNAIEHELDMSSFYDQQEIEEIDLDRIDTIKQRVVDVFNEELGTAFSI